MLRILDFVRCDFCDSYHKYTLSLANTEETANLLVLHLLTYVRADDLLITV